MWQWLIERSTANVTRSSPFSHRPLILYTPWGCPHPSHPSVFPANSAFVVAPLLGSSRRIAPQFSTSLFVHYAISRPRDDDTVRCFIDLLISREISFYSHYCESFGCYFMKIYITIYICVAKMKNSWKQSWL